MVKVRNNVKMKMAHFDIQLRLPLTNFHQDVINVCYCCLTHNEVMLNLANCKHKDFLQDYLKINCSTVCINCHNMLKKISNFRLQVQKTRELLQQGIYENTTKIVLLQRSDIKLLSILEDYKLNENHRGLNLKQQLAKDSPSSQTAELYIKEEPERGHSSIKMASQLNLKQESTKESSSMETTEIKIEYDKSETRNKLPLSQIKIRNSNKKEQMPSLEEKFIGKIGKLKLSKEELILERENEALSLSYLKLPFKCKSCIKGFDIESTLQTHNKNKHMKDGIKCDICYTVHNSESSHKQHCKEHVTRYVCMVCGKRSTSIYTVAHHYNKHHTDMEPIAMEFTCSECDYTTSSRRAIQYHRYKHKPKPQCAECGKAFTTANSLRKHVDVVHNKLVRLFKCPVCEKAYRCNAGLLSHQASHGHGGPPVQSHYCAPCQKHFPSKGRLNYHLRTTSVHLTEDSKRFACHDCDAKFPTKNALQTHIEWEHLKSMKYECQKCHKIFKSPYVLKIHVDFVHEKKKRPQNKICDHCGKGFTAKASLVSHIRTHTGERPLHCPHCPATFAHPAARYTHIKLLHKK